MLIETDEQGSFDDKDLKGLIFFFDLTVTVKTTVAKAVFNFTLSQIKPLMFNHRSWVRRMKRTKNKAENWTSLKKVKIEIMNINVEFGS